MITWSLERLLIRCLWLLGRPGAGCRGVATDFMVSGFMIVLWIAHEFANS